MKSRWILRTELFEQPGSYTIRLPTGSGWEAEVTVDENRCFELDREAPEGILSIARPVSHGGSSEDMASRLFHPSLRDAHLRSTQMGTLDVRSVTARTLKAGDYIRVEDARFEHITSIEFDESQLIVGGPENKTATALKVTTDKGTQFLVHPGQLVGVKLPMDS